MSNLRVQGEGMAWPPCKSYYSHPNKPHDSNRNQNRGWLALLGSDLQPKHILCQDLWHSCICIADTKSYPLSDRTWEGQIMTA